MYRFINKTVCLVLFLVVFMLATGCSSKESNNNEAIKPNITEQTHNTDLVKVRVKTENTISTDKESTHSSPLQDKVYGYS